MAELWENNNKQWFDRNRQRYEEFVRQPLKALAQALAGPVSTIIPEFSGDPKISRINNDIRFSPHKPLYKEHMWISFGGSGESCGADIFAAVDRHGWCTGCGIASPKREPLDNWRKNLLEFAPLWRQYMKVRRFGDEILAHFENKYKKPLYPDIPDDLCDLVQAKGVWLVEKPRLIFKKAPEKEFFAGICRNLPIFLFMSQSPKILPQRLAQLGRIIPAPDDEVAQIWSVFR